MTNYNKKPTSIVVFGGTGDLAKRKLFPAFFNLFIDGWMPEQFEIFALGRTDHAQEAFRAYVLENILEFSRNRNFSDEQWHTFSQRIMFIRFDITRDESFLALKSRLDEVDTLAGTTFNRLFYLSVAPSFIETVSKNLKHFELVPNVTGDRIIIEKPFGYDKASAIHLNQWLAETFDEEQIYRIDHYLGKETVQNILAFRFSNTIFEPVWSNKHIDSVEITVAEKVGVEDRGGYYDHSGALRDMIQNHLLQILCMVTMEAPARFESSEIRNRKVELLRDVRRILPEDVNHYAVRAQYTAGEMDDKPKVAYRAEPGVNPESTTETYAAIKFYIDNERWKGVPFYMRTGKSMTRKQSFVAINFKELQLNPFQNGKSELQPNRLIVNIQPEMDIRLCFMAKKPGLEMIVQPAEMVFDYFHCAPESPEAYETLLLDALDGDSTLFMRSDQVEEAWDVISTIQEAWAAKGVSPIHTYPVGSWGPDAANDLLERRGHQWHSGAEVKPKTEKHA